MSDNFSNITKEPMFWKGTYFENNYSASEDEFTNLVTNFRCAWEDLVKFNRFAGTFSHIFGQGNHNLQSKNKETMSEEPWDLKMFERSTISIKIFFLNFHIQYILLYSILFI